MRPSTHDPHASNGALARVRAGVLGLRHMRATLDDPRLYLRKVGTEFLAAYALLPLISVKSQLPALLYVGGMLALHVVVFAAYAYRIRFRDLAPDARSLIVRAAGIGVIVYLLWITVDFSGQLTLTDLATRLFVMSMLHSAVIAMLMLRLTSHEVPPLAERTEPPGTSRGVSSL